MNSISSQFNSVFHSIEFAESTLKNSAIPFELEQNLKATTKEPNFLNFSLIPIDVKELTKGDGNDDEDDLLYEYEQFNYNENFNKMDESMKENQNYKDLILKLSKDNQNLKNNNLDLTTKIFSNIPFTALKNIQTKEQESFLNKLFFLNYDFLKQFVIQSEEQDKKLVKLLEDKIIENQQLQTNLDKLQSKFKKQEEQFKGYLNKGKHNKPTENNQPAETAQETQQNFQQEDVKTPEETKIHPKEPPNEINQEQIKLNIIDENSNQNEETLNKEIQKIKDKFNDKTPPFKDSDHMIIVKNALDLDTMSLADSVSTVNSKQNGKTKAASACVKKKVEQKKNVKIEQEVQQQPVKIAKKPTVSQIMNKGKKK